MQWVNKAGPEDVEPIRIEYGRKPVERRRDAVFVRTSTQCDVYCCVVEFCLSCVMLAHVKRTVCCRRFSFFCKHFSVALILVE